MAVYKNGAAFIADTEEDLQEMRPQRIAGLGITLWQLEEWLRKQ